MELLLFSDLHTDTEAAKRMVALSETVDVVIGAGDFANARLGISKCIDILRRIRVPTVLVPGNNESLKELLDACRSWSAVHVLHGGGIDIGGQHVFGLGGGIPVTPFGSWSWDFSEEEGEALLAIAHPARYWSHILRQKERSMFLLPDEASAARHLEVLSLA